MNSPTAEERSRLAFVAPWSMVSIIAFGYIVSRFGISVALLSVFVIVTGATLFFPRTGVAANSVYKMIFVVAMMGCFVSIVVLPRVLSQDYEKAIWLGSYAVAIGIIEMAGMFFEHNSKS